MKQPTGWDGLYTLAEGDRYENCTAIRVYEKGNKQVQPAAVGKAWLHDEVCTETLQRWVSDFQLNSLQRLISFIVSSRDHGEFVRKRCVTCAGVRDGHSRFRSLCSFSPWCNWTGQGEKFSRIFFSRILFSLSFKE